MFNEALDWERRKSAISKLQDTELYKPGDPDTTANESNARLRARSFRPESHDHAVYGAHTNCSFISVCMDRLDEIESRLAASLNHKDRWDEELIEVRHSVREQLKGVGGMVVTEVARYNICVMMSSCSVPHKMWPQRELVDTINEVFPRP